MPDNTYSLQTFGPDTAMAAKDVLEATPTLADANKDDTITKPWFDFGAGGAKKPGLNVSNAGIGVAVLVGIIVVAALAWRG